MTDFDVSAELVVAVVESLDFESESEDFESEESESEESVFVPDVEESLDDVDAFESDVLEVSEEVSDLEESASESLDLFVVVEVWEVEDESVPEKSSRPLPLIHSHVPTASATATMRVMR
jgi:hypothetical protein